MGFDLYSMEAFLKEVALNIARREVLWMILAIVAVFVAVKELEKE